MMGLKPQSWLCLKVFPLLDLDFGWIFMIICSMRQMLLEILGSLRITNINLNINTHIKNLFKISAAWLILNRFFTFGCLFLFMFVIRKLPNQGLSNKYTNSEAVISTILAVSLFPTASILWVLLFRVTCFGHCAPNYAQDATTQHAVLQSRVNAVVIATTNWATILWVLWHFPDSLYSMWYT